MSVIEAQHKQAGRVVQWLDITEDRESQRLDNFLMLQLKGVPKSKIYQIIRKGEVRVNGGRKKPCYKLKVGDRLRIPPVRTSAKADQPAHPRPIKDFSDWVLFEDAGLLVVDKPSGLAVHGGSGVSQGLIEMLRAHYPSHQYLELVHRLDRDTSGVILVAKKRSVLKQVQEQLRLKQMRKSYFAILDGVLDADQIKVEAPLLKNVLSSGERLVRVDDERGKESLTYFKLKKVLSGHQCLVEVMPVTGRTHQIRVHAAHLGCPIVNDPKYGRLRRESSDQSASKPRKGFLMLHAAKLEFNYGDQHLCIESSMPDRFQAFLN